MNKCCYNHPKYPDTYIEVCLAREFSYYWELKVRWRLKSTREILFFDPKMLVDKKNLKQWDYNSNGSS